MVACGALSEHREYLGDNVRLDSYQKALSALVKSGDVVLDLGSGTGILGLMACRAGAGRVYAVEAGPIIGLAREICRANGFLDRVTFIRGWSTEIELPEKIDVVVADQIGNFGFNTGLVRFFADARERFLKPGGILVPSSVDLYAVPVECPAVFADVNFWCVPRLDFNLSAVHSVAANAGHFTSLRANQLLAPPSKLTSLDLAAPHVGRGALAASASFTVNRSATLHGIGTWFSAQLAKDLIITNSPLAKDASRRRHLVFPIGRPVPVSKGDQVEVKIRSLHEESVVSWRVEVAGKASFNHSTWNGMLICEEDVRRTSPDFVPNLTRRGQARLSVLSLCNGRRPLSEIERETYRMHPTLFHSPKEAAIFVAEVLARYSR